jgi:hypothetical protein
MILISLTQKNSNIYKSKSANFQILMRKLALLIKRIISYDNQDWLVLLN